MFAFLRTWVEHDLFLMLSPPVHTDLQENKMEGLRPSCSTHVRKNANMGHPSRGIGLVANRESGGRNYSQPDLLFSPPPYGSCGRVRVGFWSKKLTGRIRKSCQS